MDVDNLPVAVPPSWKHSFHTTPNTSTKNYGTVEKAMMMGARIPLHKMRRVIAERANQKKEKQEKSSGLITKEKVHKLYFIRLSFSNKIDN